MKRLERARIALTGFLWKLGVRYLGGRGLQRVWPFGMLYRKMDRALQQHDWPESFVLEGHTIFFPKIHRAAPALYGDSRQREEFAFFEREIVEGATVLDIGANFGRYALVFARAAGPQGRVFAFEPGPENVTYLQKNVAANGYNNIEVVPKAVGDHTGIIELHLSDFNAGDHRIFDTARGTDASFALDQHSAANPRKTTPVDLVTLDDFFKEYPKPINFVKIDVQGSEGGVIHGMRNILQKNPNIKLHFEFHPALMRAFGTDPQEVLESLTTLGFTLYDTEDVRGTRVRELVSITPSELLARYGKNESTDIFAKRG